MTATETRHSDDRRAVLKRSIRGIVGFTIGDNAIEAVIAIDAGSAASSAALIGFGSGLGRRGTHAGSSRLTIDAQGSATRQEAHTARGISIPSPFERRTAA